MANKRGKGKRPFLLLSVVFILSILFIISSVSALTAQECKDGGGIYCNSGDCVLPNLTANGFGDKVCIVSNHQVITVPLANKYQMEKLHILPSGKLKFQRHKDVIATLQDQSIQESRLGGAGGAAGEKKSQGKGGGAGGDGGAISRLGEKGDNAVYSSAESGANGLAEERVAWAGAEIAIFASEIIIDGEIDLSGFDGNPGGDARDCNTPIGGNHFGFGGAGGGGGSGAGQIYFFTSQEITGSGKINLTGGTGGNGGKFNDEDCDKCATDDDDWGGGGGAGGGGAGGLVYSNKDIFEDLVDKITCTGGTGGTGGCSDKGKYAGKEGLSGTPGDDSAVTGTSCIELISGDEDICDDEIDNDNDGLYDMQDERCFTSKEEETILLDEEGICPSVNYGPISQYPSNPYTGFDVYSWFNPLAKNGNDACCGDDSGTCGFLPGADLGCEELSQPECTGSCKWTTGNYEELDEIHVFVTSETHNGNFGGVMGADAFCQQAADNQGLGGVWTAWISVADNPVRDRIQSWDANKKFVLLDGTIVADNLADFLDGSLKNPININESGEVIIGTKYVWTGTSSDGTAAKWYSNSGVTSTFDNCLSWTKSPSSIQYAGISGDTSKTDGSWTRAKGFKDALDTQAACSNKYRVYCFNPNPIKTLENSCQPKEEFDCEAMDRSNCLDNTDICEFSEAGDLGFITEDGDFACFDNARIVNTQITPQIILDEPNNEYVWRDALDSQNNLKIMQAQKTQFVSNSVSWYYCDATGSAPYGANNKINEYGTFPAAVTDGYTSCSNSLNAVMEISDTENCYDNTLENCKKELEENTADPLWFCVGTTDAGGNKQARGYNPFLPKTDPQGFDKNCGTNCYVREGYGSYQSFNKYHAYKGTYFEAICSSNKENAYLIPWCGMPVKKTESAFDSEECLDAADFEQCLNAYTNVNNPCSQVANSLGETDFALCSPNTQYCSVGTQYYSKEAGQLKPEYQCCVGENAACADLNAETCELIENGHWKPEGDDGAICLTQLLGDSCCIGEWFTEASTFLTDAAINGSFICFERDESSLIQECCQGDDCYNTDNPLSTMFDGTIMNSLTSNSGETQNILIDFPGTSGRLTGISYSSPLKFSYELNDFHYKDWSGFSSLVIDFRVNTNDIDKVILVDSSGKTYEKDIQEIKETRKDFTITSRIRMPLAASNFDLSNVKEIIIQPKDGALSVAFLFAKIFLDSAASNQNSQSYYCAGNWKQWVENLDGKDNKGFYGQNQDISVYGPYEEACSKKGPFGWTGGLCCGDDTVKGAYGEFFVDKEGMCWNGTYIPSKKTGWTVAMSRGKETAEPNEGAILYFNDGTDSKVYLCDTDKSEFDNVKFSYGITAESQNILDKSLVPIEKAGLYSIKGDFMCEPGTNNQPVWTNIKDMNRIKMIASKLLSDAIDNNKDFTLFCGDSKEVSNIDIVEYFGLDAAVGIVEATDTIEKACVFKEEKNQVDQTKKVFYGFELALDVDVDEFAEKIIARFNPFTIPNLNVSCDNVPDYPDANSFFEKCEIKEPLGISTSLKSKFKVYYNKPLNLMIIGSGSGGELIGDKGFFEEIWTGFTNFFATLFGTNPNYDLIKNFSENDDMTDFYASSQGDNSIFGIIQSTGGKNIVTVNYVNLKTDVSVLAKLFKASNPDFHVSYRGSENTQEIFAVAPLNIKPDWKHLTGMLRLKNNQGHRLFPNVLNDGKISFEQECDNDDKGNIVLWIDEEANCKTMDETYSDLGYLTCDEGMLNYVSCIFEDVVDINEVLGLWSGNLGEEPATLEFVVELQKPAQGTSNYWLYIGSNPELTEINQDVIGIYDVSRRTLTLEDQAHSRYKGTYVGKVSADMSSYTGTFTTIIDGEDYPFSFTSTDGLYWTGTLGTEPASLTLTYGQEVNSGNMIGLTNNWLYIGSNPELTEINQEVTIKHGDASRELILEDQLRSRYKGIYVGTLSEDLTKYEGIFTTLIDGDEYPFTFEKGENNYVDPGNGGDEPEEPCTENCPPGTVCDDDAVCANYNCLNNVCASSSTLGKFCVKHSMCTPPEMCAGNECIVY